jgi:hypothetical protein
VTLDGFKDETDNLTPQQARVLAALTDRFTPIQEVIAIAWPAPPPPTRQKKRRLRAQTYPTTQGALHATRSTLGWLASKDLATADDSVRSWRRTAKGEALMQRIEDIARSVRDVEEQASLGRVRKGLESKWGSEAQKHYIEKALRGMDSPLRHKSTIVDRELDEEAEAAREDEAIAASLRSSGQETCLDD